MRLRNLLKNDIWIGSVLLLILSLPFVFTDLDLTLSSFFYKQAWQWGEHEPWHLLYRLGTLPGLFLATGGLFLLAGAWIWPRLQTWRRPALLLVATMLIGPGLLINALGKQYWGRPRPRDVLEFNGDQAFQRFYKPGTPGCGHSFPCGHASVGFVFTALYFIGRNRRRQFVYLGIGLGYGSLLGMARIVQGGHFASDVLFAGGITYLTAAILHHVIIPETKLSRPSPAAAATLKQKIIGWVGLGCVLPACTAFFLIATPYNKQWTGEWDDPTGLVRTVSIHLQPGKESILIRAADQKTALKIQANLRGFGWPKLRLSGDLQPILAGTTLVTNLLLQFDRLTTERTGSIIYSVRKDLIVLLDQQGSDANLQLGDDKLPIRLGPLQLLSRKGNLQLYLASGARLEQPISLSTLQGTILIHSENITVQQPIQWLVANQTGPIRLALHQNQSLGQPWQLTCRSGSGALQLEAQIHADCGLDLSWNQISSGLKPLILLDENWNHIQNHIWGPIGGTRQPELKIQANTQSGPIRLQISQARPVYSRSHQLEEQTMVLKLPK